MSRSRIVRNIILTAGLSAAIGTTGCEQLGLLDALEERSSLVQVFATHHASPEDGRIPDRGGDGQSRVFDTDEGWTVTLTQGYVVTTGVTLHRCDGAAEPVELFWGPFAEDILDTDLDLFTVGSAEVEPGRFCSMTVHYGTYDAQEGAAGPEADVVDGATVYLHGLAERGDESVPFEVRAQGGVDVDLDLSSMEDGAPLRVTGEESFPVELTLSKTYDRFFDAIDFTAMAQLDMGEHVLGVLEGETRVAPGTRVAPSG